MVETGLVNLLATLPALIPLINGRVFDRQQASDDTRSCIVYTLLSRRPIKDLQGETGLSEARYQLQVFAPTPKDVRRIMSALHSAVGTKTSFAGVQFRWLWVEDESDAIDPAQMGQEIGDKYGTVTVTVWSE